MLHLKLSQQACQSQASDLREGLDRKFLESTQMNQLLLACTLEFTLQDPHSRLFRGILRKREDNMVFHLLDFRILLSDI
jgi:hypothetical protein